MDKETIVQLLSDGVISNEVAERYFPELKEGERIRKSLITFFKHFPYDSMETAGTNAKDAIAWLEKQGEQNHFMIQWKGDNLKEVIDFTGVYKEGFEKWFHNSWEEYEKYVHEHNNIFKIFNEDGSHIEVPVGAWIVKTPDGYNIASRYVFRQKPAAWSENDEKYIYNIHYYLEHPHLLGKSNKHIVIEMIDWLKSLKERYTWSPSDEQMKALNAINATGGISYVEQGQELINLFNDLKKLREE